MARRKRAKGMKLPRQPKNQIAFGFVERCEDLPLFSGSPPRVREEAFDPQPRPRQSRLFGRPRWEELKQ